MSDHYYISTGAQGCFFTLRYTFTENLGERVAERDYHVCNLSTNRESAIQKAKDRTGVSLDTEIEVRPITRRQDIDWSILQAGKYQGRSIHALLQTDQKYLLWLAENCAKTKGYEKTVELLKALLSHQLQERQDQRTAEAQAEAAKRLALAERTKPVAEILKQQNGDFCKVIAIELEMGQLPRGRATNIVKDIYAKAFGRRNSKAYNEAYDKAAELLGEEVAA